MWYNKRMDKQKHKEMIDRLALTLQDMVEDQVADLMMNESEIADLVAEDSDELPEIWGAIMDKLATNLKEGEK